MIEVKDVTVIYPGPIDRPEKNFVALNSVSFQISKGSQVSIVGSSGAGKSTLLRVINGTLKPNAGLVFLDGTSIYNLDVSERENYRSKILFMASQKMEENLFYELTVEENLTLFQLSRSPNIKQNLNLSQRIQIFNDLEILYTLNRPVESLSGGEKQLVVLSLALMMGCQIIILDEPTSSLDQYNKHVIMQRISQYCRSNHVTLIYSTHDYEISKYADLVIGLSYGRFDRILDRRFGKNFDGNLLELLNNKYYHVPIDTKGVIQIPKFMVDNYSLDKFVLLKMGEGKIELFPFELIDNETESDFEVSE